MRIGTFAIVASLMLMTGCATVPKESVDLSIELTRMIRSAEKSHLAMLDLFITERKQRADEFLREKWTPKFMEHAFRDTGVLDTIKAQRTDAGKEAVMKEFSEDAASTIAEQRAVIMDAIQSIGTMLSDSIKAHYDDMLTASQALTAHIRSVAEVTETQAKILSVLKVNPDTLLPLDKINGVLEKVLSYEGKAREIASYIEEAKKILKGK